MGVIIFMSDGVANDWKQAAHYAGRIQTTVGVPLKLYTVAFGSEAHNGVSQRLLEEMAREANLLSGVTATSVAALTGRDLEREFANIAVDEDNVRELLVESISNQLSEDMGLKIATNFV